MEKFPELRALFNKLEAEKATIRARSAPLRAQRDKLLAKIQPLEVEERDLIKQINEIERPRLAEIDNQLGGLAKAMGGKTLSDAG